MSQLDLLGKRHARLLAELEQLREDLGPAIREARAEGATYVELMNRSGYTSMETIRQIVKPEAREAIKKRRRQPASAS